MLLRGEGRPPHITQQTDPTVGLLWNMWRSSTFRLIIKKPQTSYSRYKYIFMKVYGVFFKRIYVTTFQRVVLRGEGRPPHIPPQTDPTVGLFRNMWRSSRSSANYQKATDFL